MENNTIIHRKQQEQDRKKLVDESINALKLSTLLA